MKNELESTKHELNVAIEEQHVSKSMSVDAADKINSEIKKVNFFFSPLLRVI